MKICFVASHFPQGGAERQITELIKGLVKKDFDITLLLYQSNELFYDELFKLPIKIVRNNRVENGNRIYKWILNILFLQKKLRQENYDILHTYLFHNGLIVRLFSGKKYKGKILYSVRNSYQDASLLYRIADKFLSSKSINVFNSRKSLNEFSIIKRNSKSNLHLIYNGFDIKRFNNDGRIKNTEIVFGTVGRFTKQKNQIQILEALALLKMKNNFNFKLYLIGDSLLDKTTQIREFISNNNLSENVMILDSQKNIEEYYKKFDVFILSSIYEGCPNVLFEALLSGCLCIISKGANSDGFIVSGENGYVYDGTTDDLVKLISEVNSKFKENALQKTIVNGVQYALNNFSIESMVEKYISIYYCLIKSDKSKIE